MLSRWTSSSRSTGGRCFGRGQRDLWQLAFVRKRPRQRHGGLARVLRGRPATTKFYRKGTHCETNGFGNRGRTGVADVGGWHVLSIAYKPPEASEVFYARAFRALRSTVLRRLVRDEGLPAQVQQVILCIFETYSCLNRFEVYMALRGHEVHLIDGVGSSTAWVEAEDSPQTPSAPLWLCLLSEDVEDEYSATSLLKDWLPRSAGNHREKRKATEHRFPSP
ncbi:hypothetical protein LSM04_007294 [Trypanosoma melophagium]|uniref:uncharacterized protein n=1 Tax=Trypanosoma melophagium TaxID=715481 RepID=UPI00351A609F|nr:hypothetical protein LSM04_007294 [Trypanosoma melophagium]